jgi:hypothetical protein
MEPALSLQLEPPATFRALNRLTAPFGSSFADLHLETFVRWAERDTGLTDFGDDGFLDRAARLCDAIRTNPNLTPSGRFSLRVYYHMKFANQLRVVDYAKRHPDVHDVPVHAPIIVTGFYRTGTTLMQNLLGADPTHGLPRTWELTVPVPMRENRDADRAVRRALTTFILSSNRYIIPDQAAAHYITVDGPEECFFLQENSAFSTTLFNTYQAYDYAHEILDWDREAIYRALKLQYQILTHRSPAKRLVLKCPFHLWNLDAVMKVFPDAKILQMHRDVTKSLPSICSLSAMTTSKFAHTMDLRKHGRFWADYYRIGIDRAFAVRPSIPSNQLADVRLSDLTKDLVGTIRRLYAQFELPWDDYLASRYRVRLMDNPKDAHGTHVYSLEEFGLDPAEIRSRFADYQERFELVPKTNGKHR